MKLLLFLKILMMPLTNPRVLNDNYYITDYLKRFSPQEEETNALQDSMEEEIVETECSLDEKEEESDEQKEEEWSSYPSQPSNESNSLTLTLYDFPPCIPKEDECYNCYDSMNSFEISLFDEIDACGHDAPMNDTCKDDFATVIYDKPCYLDESYDKPLFLPTMDVFNDEEVCLESLYDYVLVDHEKHALCDGYIIEFVHDATENYYERRKYGYRNFHVRKTPLSMLKILKVLLFYLPMLVALCFIYLFFFKLPMHRKHVRLKWGLSLLL